MKSHGMFSYLRVLNSGLKVHHEKPELMFQLLKKWIKSETGSVIDE